MPGKCLFSAPFAFMPRIDQSYNAVLPTEFREIWKRGEIRPDPEVTAWMVNPGQNFIVDDGVLDLFPGLEVIVTPSTGSNHIDRPACEGRGIAVYSLLDDRGGLERISASAEYTFLLLLNALRRLDLAAREVDENRWRDREDELRGNELSGKTVGLVGLGRIGRRMARYCAAFDAEIVYHDPYVKDDSLPAVPIEALFSSADIVVVCCVLNDETRGMIGGELLSRLKPGACLVNTARGEVVDEAALAEAVRERPDLRVAVDVVAGEVTGAQFSSPLVALHKEGRVLVSPHIAGATLESQEKAALMALALLKRHLAAAPD